MKTKLLFITGSRGEWGYIRPILNLCKRSRDFEYSLCVTNMHLLPSFGNSAKEIAADGFRIHHRIYMAFDGYTHVSMVKSLGSFLMSLADVLSADRPDWMVLAGDRGEQLMGAIAGAFSHIPVAHIQAGELSGNIDGMTRHAIGKYAHLHFASNADAAQRLLRLGEEAFRVHNVGAPQLDELRAGLYSDAKAIESRFPVKTNRDYILVVQHPVTEEYDKAASQIRVTFEVLDEIPVPKIVILPNNDAGTLFIRDGIEKYRRGQYHVYANLRREDYLGLMKHAACIVGNSSSGLLEAPSFRIPAVNLGRRQAGRMQGPNVINARFDDGAIRRALRSALSAGFRAQLRRSCVNPYGDGRSAQRILDCLRRTPIDSKLLVKGLTY